MAKIGERDRKRLSPFVDEMVSQRESRGWSQADLASRAGYSKSLIGSVETYERPPTDPLAKALDHAFELPGTFLRLYELVRGSAFPAVFGEFAGYEAQAAELLIFEHGYVPGLLQTEEYAHAVLSHHYNVTEDQVCERVKARLKRQEILTRVDPVPPALWVLIDEFVLHREIGGPEVMASQCVRLLESAGTNVTVQVIPKSTGAHPGLGGKFDIAELRDGAVILFAEDIRDGSITDEPATVAEAMQKWRYLSSLALPAAQSLEVIREAEETWRKQM